MLIPLLLRAEPADSLKSLLPAASKGEKIDLLVKLSLAYSDIELDSSLIFARQAKEFYNETGDTSKAYMVFYTLGLAFDYAAQLDSAIFWYQKSYEKAVTDGNLKRQAASSVNLGIVYKNMLQMEHAIQSHLRGLDIYEKLNDTTGIIRTCVNIATVYSSLWDMTNALRYYDRALVLSKKINLEMGILMVSSGIGVVELKRRNPEKAFSHLAAFYNKAKELQYNTYIIAASLNLGYCYMLLGKPDSALVYLEESELLAEKIGDQGTVLNIQATKGLCYGKMGDFERGEKLLTSALERSAGIPERLLRKEIYQQIVEFYILKNDSKKAAQYFKELSILSDSLSTLAGAESIQLLSNKYELEKKEREIANLKNKEQNLEIERQQLIILLSAVLLLAGVGLIIYLVNSNKRRKRYAQELESEIERRKKAELQTLVDTNDKLQLIMKFARLGYLEIQKRERRVSSAELFFSNILDAEPLTRENFSLQDLRSYFSEESFNELTAFFDKLFSDVAEVKERNYDMLFTAQDGRKYYTNMLVLPEGDLHSEELRLRILIQDITERKTNEELIATANERLTRLNAVKDRFFSIIAHDLKNPFHGLMGITQLINTELQPKLSPDEAEMVGLLNRVASNAYELLENLLEWARTQTGGIVYTPEKIMLDALVDEVLTAHSAQAKMKSLSMRFEADPMVFVTGDRYMIHAVLRNLISNAIKFSHPGKEVSVSYSLLNDKVLVCVADQGVGITEKTAHKLFMIEEKISTPGTNQETGTGLGLALAHEFIGMNGGEIWVESKVGEGSRFYFSLPLVKEQ